MTNGECSSTDYDHAESWCREKIASGHCMMFSLSSFHHEIASASQKFGLSFEVGTIHSLHQLLYFSDVEVLLTDSPWPTNTIIIHITSHAMLTSKQQTGLTLPLSQRSRYTHETHLPLDTITNYEACEILLEWYVNYEFGKEM